MFARFIKPFVPFLLVAGIVVAKYACEPSLRSFLQLVLEFICFVGFVYVANDCQRANWTLVCLRRELGMERGGGYSDRTDGDEHAEDDHYHQDDFTDAKTTNKEN